MNLTVNNQSTQALLNIPSYSSLSVLVMLGVFVSIILTIFLVSKNFRSFVIGSVFTLGLFSIGWFSKFVGIEVGEGNLTPLKYVVYVIIFILLSIVIGKFISKTKKWQEFEEDFNKTQEDLK